MPLFEVVGNADKLPPLQIGDTCVNVGVVGRFSAIVTVTVVVY